jgi:hypothetical protein
LKEGDALCRDAKTGIALSFDAFLHLIVEECLCLCLLLCAARQ